jgi:SET domain-containing protein
MVLETPHFEPHAQGIESGLWYRQANSGIHRFGLFANRFIPKGTRIIEYRGERITKKESERRGLRQMEVAETAQEGSVYIFELNKRYDLDGNTPDNLAKYINHSCEPNCEAALIKGKIWIEALYDIPEGDELFFDYGYDAANSLDHPCRCGSKACVGYIVRRDQRTKLKRFLKKITVKAPETEAPYKIKD